jgi:hypothetical protein
MNKFDLIKKRMPHFFNNCDVLEYVPHDKSKSIKHLFSNCRYVVIDPKTKDLSNMSDNSFKVVISVEYFQHTSEYLNHFIDMHRVSSKFILFSCAVAGRPKIENKYHKNLTQSDFYNSLDFDKMFETYKFDVDYSNSTLYFWGIKRSL